jgi:hypothetical protein
MKTVEELTLLLMTIRPGAKWALTGPTYDKLRWDDTEQPKPTPGELGL